MVKNIKIFTRYNKTMHKHQKVQIHISISKSSPEIFWCGYVYLGHPPFLLNVQNIFCHEPLSILTIVRQLYKVTGWFSHICACMHLWTQTDAKTNPSAFMLSTCSHTYLHSSIQCMQIKYGVINNKCVIYTACDRIHGGICSEHLKVELIMGGF